MDSKDAQAERLKRMQMADLGIHRRDYISARDDRKNIPHVRMEDLEAARQSNIPGTTAHGEAQRNKRILSEWTSLHRTVGDTTNSDSQLDSLMHGQSHRAQLNLTFHHDEGQAFNFGNTASTFKHNHPLPPMPPGRGRGVIGKRVRRALSPPSFVAAPKVRVPSLPNLMPRRMDPALESNAGSVSSSGSRGSRRSRGRSVSGSYGTRTPNVRRTGSSRPERSTPPKISTPHDFLAAHHRLTTATTQSSSEPSLKHGPEIATSSPSQSKSKALPIPETPTPPTGRCVKPSQPIRTTTNSTKALAQPRAVSAQTKVPSETVISSLIATNKTPQTNKKPGKLLPNICLSLPLPMRVKENTQKGTVASQELSGILLDSGGSRETMIPQAPQFMSPALADLKGLDFCFETDNTNSSGGGVIDFKFKGKANTPAALSVEKKEGDDGLMKFKHPEAVLYNFHDNSKPSSSPELSTTKEAMKNEVTSKPTNDPTAPPQEPTLKAIKAAPATPSKPVFGDSFKGYREQPYSPFSPDSKEPTSEESKEYVDAPEQVTPSKKEKPQNTITSMFLKQAQRQALKKETAEENVFLKAPKSPKRPTKVFAVAAPTQFHNVLAESIHAPPPPMELFNAPTVFAQSPPAPLFFAQQRPALPNAFRQFNKAKTIGVQPYLPTKLAPNVSECSSQLSELPLSYELRQPTLGLKQDSANTVLAGICGPHTIDPAPFQGRAKKATDNTQKESKTTPIKPSEDSPPLSQLYSPTSHFQGTDENLRPSMPRVLGNQPFQSRKPSQPR